MTDRTYETYDHLRGVDLDHATAAEIERLCERAVMLRPKRPRLFAEGSTVPPRRRLEGALRVFEIEAFGLAARHRPQLRALRDAFRGRDRCFVLGTGPGLDGLDLARLEDEITFAVDDLPFGRLPPGFVPTFYLATDAAFVERNAVQIAALCGPTKLLPTDLARCLDDAADTIFFDRGPEDGDLASAGFSSDATQAIDTRGGAACAALQLAHYLGFRKIHLIGADASDASLDVYGRAAEVTETAGRPIVVSDIEPSVEAFAHEPYDDLLPQPDPRVVAGPADAGFPRVLVVDATAMGDLSATGELKATLLGCWPRSRLMQAFAAEHASVLRQAGCGDLRAAPGASVDELVQAAAAFAPDVILYRPAPGEVGLHRLLLAVLAERPVPVALWIMDNWMGALRTEQPEQYALYDEDMRALLALSPFGLAISAQMAGELEARYGLPFRAVANGVDLELFAALRAKAPAAVEGRLVVRYAGGLSERMGLDTLLALARAVETLSTTSDVRLEISTRDHWIVRAGHRFAGLKAIGLSARDLPREEYFAWLCGADVVAVCYNFDEASRVYAGASLANKLPECLASGAATLAIGPPEFATMRALAQAGCGVTVGTAEEGAIEGALEALMDNRRRAAIVARQIEAVGQGYDQLVQREALRAALLAVARTPLDLEGVRDLVRRSRLSPWRADAMEPAP